jgi:hypothetical protein
LGGTEGSETAAGKKVECRLKGLQSLRRRQSDKFHDNSSEYDLAVRAWARHEPDLGVRTRVFVVAHSFDQLLTIGRSREEALEELDARHAFFTRR